LTAAGALVLGLAAHAPSVRRSPPSLATSGLDAVAVPGPQPSAVSEATSMTSVTSVTSEATPNGAAIAVSAARDAARSNVASAASAPQPTFHEGKPTARGRRTSLSAAEELLAEGEVVGACKRAEAVFARTPSAAGAAFLGRCYMRLGDKARSFAFYRRYLALEPEGSDAVFVRAIVGSSGR
jgi:hypothetical protein